MSAVGKNAGSLMEAAGAGHAPAVKNSIDVRKFLLEIKKADAALLHDDWRENYSCFMWQKMGGLAPPAWASVFGNDTICPGWNSSCGCSAGSLCELEQVCTVCRSPEHGVLSKNTEDEYECPSTRALHDIGHDVVDYSAVVKVARSCTSD